MHVSVYKYVYIFTWMVDEEEDGVVHVGLVTIILGFQLSAFPENLVKKSFQS